MLLCQPIFSIKKQFTLWEYVSSAQNVSIQCLGMVNAYCYTKNRLYVTFWFCKFTVKGLLDTSVKLVGYLILDIGYSILENFPCPAPHERSLSVMRYGLTNDTVF